MYEAFPGDTERAEPLCEPVHVAIRYDKSVVLKLYLIILHIDQKKEPEPDPDKREPEKELAEPSRQGSQNNEYQGTQTKETEERNVVRVVNMLQIKFHVLHSFIYELVFRSFLTSLEALGVVVHMNTKSMDCSRFP